MDVNQHNNAAALHTLNRFYNELYDKELRLKFDDAEVTDMYNAVTDFVKNIVNTVGRRDPCLKIEEVISVGSAREGTQICSPCEYDFLLIMKELSYPEVYGTEGCPNSLSYMHVRLCSARFQHSFKDIMRDGYVKSTQIYSNEIPFYVQDGLRQKLKKALRDAAVEKKLFEVSTGSGILRFKSTNIEVHGPALMVLLGWQSKRGGYIMDISVDLCPALRVPAVRLSENVEILVTPESVTCQSYYDYAQKTGTVLLIPCRRSSSCIYGLCYKVAYTETELRLMDNISEHHKKCYKILKYLINGRPSPSIARKSVLSKVYYPFYGYPTQMHSYALKVLIWNHHFKSSRVEQNCLSLCIDELLSEIKGILTFDGTGVSNEVLVQNMLPCPFNKYASVWSKPKRNDRRNLEVDLDDKRVLRERFLLLLESLRKVSMMDNYNFEDVQIITVNNSSYDEKRRHIFATATYVVAAVLIPLLV